MVLIRDVVQQAITISYLTFLLPCHIQGGRGRPPHKKILDILLLGSLLAYILHMHDY